MPSLTIRNARKAYGATIALSRGDFDLNPGEVHVLIGSNGSGKSTLCKIISGSVKPDSGEILIDNQPVTIHGPEAAQALGIATFYQELSLAPHRTVAENIQIADLPGRYGLFVDQKELTRKAAHYIRLFSAVAGENFSADTPVARLREDQRQLVEIMKVLASEAPILIFDEPTSSLDRRQVERFFEVLHELKTQGRAIVFISHRMDEIFSIGDRVTVIRDGETVATAKLTQIDASGIIRHMVGRQEGLAPVENMPPAAVVEKSAAKNNITEKEIVLSADAISGNGFSDVSLSLQRGEILGLGGLHGQGQSALLRALFGAGGAVKGTLFVHGRAYPAGSPRVAIRAGLAYISGDRGRDGVIHGRPILENLAPVYFLRSRRILARPSRLRQLVQKPVAALKTRFARFDQIINALSGGNQQKIIIARWLVDPPDILLLDDPTKGIDLQTKADFFAFLRNLAAQGMAIILYSSEDVELLANADRILVFNGGRISRHLDGEERTRFNLYQAAYEAA